MSKTTFGNWSHLNGKQTSYEKCTVTDERGKREFHNVNGIWHIELMREGEWCLYEASEEMWSQNRVAVFGTRPRHTVVHSQVYPQTRPVYELDWPNAMYGEPDEAVPVVKKTERYDAVCYSELYPDDFEHCTRCHAPIPDKFITIWRLLNPDCLDKTNGS